MAGRPEPWQDASRHEDEEEKWFEEHAVKCDQCGELVDEYYEMPGGWCYCEDCMWKMRRSIYDR